MDTKPLTVADVLSTLRQRIQVHGDMRNLQQPNNASKIRALLLAGIRSARLWRQLSDEPTDALGDLVTDAPDAVEVGAGRIEAITHHRHGVEALEDAVFLLTTVTGIEGRSSHA